MCHKISSIFECIVLFSCHRHVVDFFPNFILHEQIEGKSGHSFFHHEKFKSSVIIEYDIAG